MRRMDWKMMRKPGLRIPKGTMESGFRDQKGTIESTNPLNLSLLLLLIYINWNRITIGTGIAC